MTLNDYNCYHKYNIIIIQQSNLIKMEDKYSMQMKEKYYFFFYLQKLLFLLKNRVLETFGITK